MTTRREFLAASAAAALAARTLGAAPLAPLAPDGPGASFIAPQAPQNLPNIGAPHFAQLATSSRSHGSRPVGERGWGVARGWRIFARDPRARLA